MKPKPIIESCIYALLIILSLATLILIWLSPSGILNSRVVYQGF
jgi:hypothetical protein